jgi:hypothetical protein
MLAGMTLFQRNSRAAILSCLIAFVSAWEARMSATRRRATAGGSSIGFCGMGPGVQAHRVRDAYYTANQREEAFPLLVRL